MTGRTAKKYLISGRVQGVGFRYFAQRAARQLGITGWARNLADGRVEVHAVGPPGEMNGFEALLRRGPSRSDVRGFEVQESSPDSSTEFDIR